MLDDLRKLIAAGERIKVIDDKSNEDLSRGILLQIIASAGAVRHAGAEHAVARRRSSASTATIQQLLTSYLEQSIGGRCGSRL